jgi:hypothetical protein
MVDASDRPGTSVAPNDDMAEASVGWPNFMELALVQVEVELPRLGRSPLEFRDTTNPDAEPFFVLDDKDEVKYWEYIEGLRKHSMQSLQMVAYTLVWHMLGAFEVSCICIDVLFGSTPFFPFVLILVLIVTRSSRSSHAVNRYLSATRAVCGQRFLVNGL